MPRLTLVVALLALSSMASAQELVPDKAIEIELKATDPVLEGHGPSRTFEYDVTFDGTLHVWAASRDFDPILRITSAQGELLAEDDDSGGGTTAWLVLEVGRKEMKSITVAAAEAGGAGSLVLHASEAPETALTRGASQRAKSELAEVKKLRGANDLTPARQLAAKSLDDLLSVEGADVSGLVAARAWDLGFETYALSLPEPTKLAWSSACRHRSRTLPGDHPDLARARADLALAIKKLGDHAGARVLEEQVLEVRSRNLPDDHLDLAKARLNLATTIAALGDLAGARALVEKVVEVLSRTLPDDHLDLLRARLNLAVTLSRLGDLTGARALEEKVLEVRSRTLPDDHRDLQQARGNLASTIKALGDLAGARALEEKVLEVRARTLPEDHPDLQHTRLNLAQTIKALGDLTGARALEEKVLEVSSRTLPEDHPNLTRARGCLAATLYMLGDFAGARALQEQVLEVLSRTRRDDDPVLAISRANLASTIKALGDLAGARAMEEKALEVLSLALPDDHPNLQYPRENLAWTIRGLVARTARESGMEGQRSEASERGRAECAKLVLALCRAQTSAARKALLESSPREAQARCEVLAARLDAALNFAAGCGTFEPIPALDRAAFVLSETTRGAALGAAALMRQASGAPEYPKLREALHRQSDELAALAQKGTTSAEFQAALTRRDALQRDLARLARELTGAAPAGLDFEIDELAARLSGKEAVVGFRRYEHKGFEGATDAGRADSAASLASSVASLCALVLRRDGDAQTPGEIAGTLTRIELGPIAPIEEAVKTWRESLGVGIDSRGVSGSSAASVARAHGEMEARGRVLRQLVFDPLLPALREADHVIVALDDVLHLVPLDALPADEGMDARGEHALLGERWRIETRATLAELLAPARASSVSGALVAVGGVAYGAAHAAERSVAELAAAHEPGADQETMPQASAGAPSRGAGRAGILRGGAWSGGFSELPATAVEVEAIAREFGGQNTDLAVTLLEGSDATRERLLELAPRARWLHVATHGWFAPESIKSWRDARWLDEKSGLGMRMSGEEQVKGMSPMLLCGLALAGANLPENAVGRVPGLITAEEISALDLSNCELVVLSACDTNVGERRAGQGVASLQMALQMAGARSVITSLWKVPDEATKELMLDFYRRLWVEKKPKWQALWEAKMKLRNAKDERGQPLYSTRDWAAWVLTGDPD